MSEEKKNESKGGKGKLIVLFVIGTLLHIMLALMYSYNNDHGGFETVEKNCN